MRNAFLFFAAAITCHGQLVISSVANAASNIQIRTSRPPYANATIAQGAMFVVWGSGMGPDSIVVASSFPLQTTFGGTSIQITVAGQTTNAIMYYTQSQQVAAILPSNTPVGSGTVKVTYNGSTGSFPIVVAQNNVAMYTVGQTGTGDAVVTRGDNTVVLPTNAPNPGDVVVLWANGLGPVSGDETLPASGGDMTSVPLEVFIGGKAAQIFYRGRSACCASLDQINVQIPQGISTGCVVSVIMRIGSVVSNTTTMPIAPSGRVCTPTNPAISRDDVVRLSGKNAVSVGIVSLERAIPRSGSFDNLVGDFKRYTGLGSLVLDEIIDVPAPGSCLIFYDYGGNPSYRAFPIANLDAGPAITVTGSTGTARLPNQGDSLYQPDKGIQFLDPGPYAVEASGGPNAGPFRATANVPPPFAWTSDAVASSDNLVHTVNRSKGITLTWSGADPSGNVLVTGVGQAGSGITTFVCSGRGSDAALTIPPIVFQALPVLGIVSGPVEIEGISQPVQFTADGLDFGFIKPGEFDSQGLGLVMYQ